MSVFENEGNVSQDANFRAHLDSNWDSGNREFNKVEGQLENALGNIQFLKNEISDWKKELENLKQQHSSDIDALNKVIAAQDKRIAQLEKAVFEAQYINDTDDKPDVDDSTKVSEINDDIVPDPYTNDSSAVVIESDNDAVIPDKIN